MLNVSCNSLPTLTPLTTLTSLEELYASSNQITELGERQVLNIAMYLCDANPIVHAEGFGNLSELKKLDLTDNAIQK